MLERVVLQACIINIVRQYDKNNWIYVKFVVLIIRSCQNKSTLSERFTVRDFWLFSEIMAKCRELYGQEPYGNLLVPGQV